MREISMLDLVTLLSALGCGLIAGAFFAFSTFVMKALGKTPARAKHGRDAIDQRGRVRPIAALAAATLFVIAFRLRA